MRTLFVPLAVLALAVPPVYSQPQAVADSLSSSSRPAARTLEAAGPLTLRSAVALVQQSNPSLSAAAREQEATEGAIVQAGAWPNPVLGAQVEDLRRDNRTTTL